MKTRILASSLLVSTLILAGCGKSDNAAAPASTPAAAPSAPAAPAIATFEVTAGDTMKFNLTRLEAKAGQEVKIVLSNLGTLPKNVMGHNLVVLKKDVDVKAFTDAAVAAAATEYIPAGSTQIVAHTKLLGPKQSDEITFKAPTEPGEYPFICSFPAHCAAGMRGVLVVQ